MTLPLPVLRLSLISTAAAAAAGCRQPARRPIMVKPWHGRTCTAALNAVRPPIVIRPSLRRRAHSRQKRRGLTRTRTPDTGHGLSRGGLEAPWARHKCRGQATVSAAARLGDYMMGRPSIRECLRRAARLGPGTSSHPPPWPAGDQQHQPCGGRASERACTGHD